MVSQSYNDVVESFKKAKVRIRNMAHLFVYNESGWLSDTANNLWALPVDVLTTSKINPALGAAVQAVQNADEDCDEDPETMLLGHLKAAGIDGFLLHVSTCYPFESTFPIFGFIHGQTVDEAYKNVLLWVAEVRKIKKLQDEPR